MTPDVYVELRTISTGFVDTLPLLKKLLPDLESYKQANVYKHVCGEDFDAHNAVGDVAALSDILLKLKPDNKDLLTHSFSTESVITQQHFDQETRKNQKTFDQLVTGKYMTNFIAHRMAESGLMFDNSKSAYRVHGVEGIQNLLTEKRDNGGPRVTKNAAVIDKIVQYFT